MSNAFKQDRRRFLGTATMSVAVARLAMIGALNVTASNISVAAGGTMKPGISNPLTALKQIDAGVLTVGYAEEGPLAGRPVILLHGWPYDIQSFADVARLLSAKGYRVIGPFIRGFGTTSFLSNETFRNGQPSALAVDV